MKYELYAYTEVGGRTENEDSEFHEQSGSRCCAAVADGLGGHEDGRIASQLTLRHIAACFREDIPIPDPAQLQARLESANQEILSRRQRADQMKSTVAALFIENGRAIWGHIGDTRLYHFYNGSLAHYTKDHSVPQISVQMGEITRDQIPGHPDRSRLLRALGDEEIRPEIIEPVTLEPGQHAFLLCSDGFWEGLREDELWLDLNKSDTPRQWIDSLRLRWSRRINAADADNNTAVAVFVEVP